MKKIKISGLIALMLLTFSCEKPKDPVSQRDAGIIPLASEPNPGIFINGNNDSYIEFTVSLSQGTSADHTQINVIHPGTTGEAKISDLTTFPATVHITLGEVISALGIQPSDIHDGDLIYVDILTTKNGITTRSAADLAITVACTYNSSLAAGSYHAVSPPTEWAVSGNITITRDLADPYTVYVKGLETIDGNTEDLGPLPMHINPATLKITADKTVLVSNVSWGPYHNLAYEGTGSFNSCDGSYTMNFSISVDEGSFGSYAFTFTRNL